MLSLAEHEKGFITSMPDLGLINLCRWVCITSSDLPVPIFRISTVVSEKCLFNYFVTLWKRLAY